MKKVAILQYRLLHYREDLFDLMKEKLEHKGIELILAHGQPSDEEKKRKDVGNLDWAIKIKNIFFQFRGVTLLWQSIPKHIRKCDLIIFMQENRIISNYFLILFSKLKKSQSVAYWGHGVNMQSQKPNGIREKWKKGWLSSVDWWFAYTASIVHYLELSGYPKAKITCLNNAIDINGFKNQIKDISTTAIQNIKNELDIPDDAITGLYCGSLYKEKRLSLMVEAADIIKKQYPQFFLIIVGDGPDREILSNASKTRDWIKLVGVRKGQEKAAYFRLSDIILNPGLVGLHILDALSAGLPMVTTNDALHSPEIDYLHHKKNGLILDSDPASYAKGIIDLLEDEKYYNQISNQALLDSEKYTVEAMADNFCRGIEQCLIQTNPSSFS